MSTLAIHSELIARLMREGEGELIRAGLPRLDQIVDHAGVLAQRGQWVPEFDAHRAIMAMSQTLRQFGGHSAEHAVGVDRDRLQALLIAMVRVAPIQKPIEGTAQPFEKVVKEEKGLLRSCHTAASKIAKRLQREPNLAFEEYQALLGEAPDRALTLKVLGQAGKAEPALFDEKGALAPIKTTVPSTLAARTTVELLVRVHLVDDRTNKALIESVSALDDAAKSILAHHPNMVELVFNGASVERADLTAAQYLDVPLHMRVVAECAVLPEARKKSRLTLLEVLESREVMDELHHTATQIGMRLNPV